MPAEKLAEVITQEHGELVFGVVAPTGTNLEAFEDAFRDLLNQFSYETNVIRLSKLAELLHTDKLGVPLDSSSEYKRIDSLMTVGNRLRTTAGRGDVLALHAVSEISRGRDHGAPFRRKVHLLRSLKHPDEAEALRGVYGGGFFLIGVYSSEKVRLEYLQDRKGMSLAQAQALLHRDQDEADDALGQHTRDAFTLSDVFISANDDKQLARFIELVFGHPFHTPTAREHAMFLAYSASLRSAQLARQVGAVVLSAGGEVIGAGANDVPRFGGGQYWPGEQDRRDHRYGGDPNDREIDSIIEDTVDRLGPVLKDGETEAAKKLLAPGRISELTEFGRVVHAEMEAIIACARTGVSVRGGTLFTTTFPCHNCAKHIVSAGIREVVYVEPYPKSRALDLHEDSIAIDDPEAEGKVLFSAFVGVAARRYFDLFSMRLGSGLPLIRKIGRKAAQWSRPSAVPRIRMSPLSYLERERIAVEQINRTVEDMDPESEESKAEPE